MKPALIFLLAAASVAFAQEKGNVVYQTAGSVGTVAFGGALGLVSGAPYSATITNESVQTLADGTRIVQNSSGTAARDSEGRTRQDTVLPAIGTLSAANAPHLIFIHDPVAQTSYTLNLTEKTAQKLPFLPPPGNTVWGSAAATLAMRVAEPGVVPPLPDAVAPATMGAPPTGVFFQKRLDTAGEDHDVQTDDLGSQTMEGVLVNGIRTTHTIPAGQIGNDRPITVVTEIWTSPELKTIVYSKRTDPRIGEQIFRLTDISRTEPSASLFTVPADFKIVDAPQPVFYRTKP
jgi:hypothetical protein